VVQAVESGLNQVLRVVTEELQNGKHGKTAVLKLIQLTLLKLSGVKLGLADIEVAKVAIVVDSSDQEEHLGPAESGDSVDSSDTIGDIGALEARGDLKREAVHFLDNVSNDGELGNTAVLELRSAVTVEGLLIDVVGEAERI
jgi:hypothetical protein